MSEKPEISIIVPVYNVQEYLGVCLDSILAQTYLNFELILVNDGSTDNSIYICQEYAKRDDRITVISQKNSGVSAARNSGLKIAKGNWIAFVDSDDWIEPNYLYKLLSVNTQGLYDWVTSGIVYKYPDSSDSIVRLNNIGPCCFDTEVEFRRFVTQELITSPCAKLYRAEIIMANNLFFDKQLDYGEDRDFNVEYLKYCRNGVISDYLGYNYRKGISQSLSTIKKGNILKGDIGYWNKLYNEFHRRGFISLESKKYLIYRLYFFISDALAISKFSTEQVSYLKTNVNWDFLKRHICLVKHDKICKTLIMSKQFSLYSLYNCIKKSF